MSQQDHFQQITNYFIEALSQDIIPWSTPYQFDSSLTENQLIKAPFSHFNGKTLKRYRSINALILETQQLKHKYEHPFWFTFKQALDNNLSVIKGSKSTPIYYNEVIYQQELTGGGKKVRISKSEYQSMGGNKNPTLSKYFFLKKYNIFNIDQLEGEYDVPVLEDLNRIDEFDIGSPEEFISNYSELPVTFHGKPAYYPSMDKISMPLMKEFDSKNDYLSVYLHEIIHSTGHQSRLNRSGIMEHNHFGSDGYAKEELVAEIGACFMASHLNIQQSPVENSKAYIQSWIKQLNDKPKMIYTAAAQAQKAADFITEHTNISITA